MTIGEGINGKEHNMAICKLDIGMGENIELGPVEEHSETCTCLACFPLEEDNPCHRHVEKGRECCHCDDPPVYCVVPGHDEAAGHITINDESHPICESCMSDVLDSLTPGSVLGMRIEGDDQEGRPMTLEFGDLGEEH